MKNTEQINLQVIQNSAKVLDGIDFSKLNSNEEIKVKQAVGAILHYSKKLIPNVESDKRDQVYEIISIEGQSNDSDDFEILPPEDLSETIDLTLEPDPPIISTTTEKVSKPTTDPSVLNAILSEEEDPFPSEFQCPNCHKMYLTAKGLTKHVQVFCNADAEHVLSSIDHLVNQSIKNGNFSCLKCNESYKERYRMTKHIKRYHAELLESSSDNASPNKSLAASKRFKCSYTGCTYSNKRNERPEKRDN